MLRLLTTIAFLVTATTTAASQYVEGTIVSVTPQYTENVRRIPNRVCKQVDVPVYQNNNSNNIITGAIVGGIIGHQFGDGNERKSNRNAGAIIGGLLGSQNHSGNIIQYRRQQQCHTEYYNDVETFISHYNIIVEVNGNRSYHQTGTPYSVGDKIRMKVFYSFN